MTKKHCEPLVAVWLRPSTTEPCICCKQVAEKPRGEHLKNDVCMYRYLLIKQWHIGRSRCYKNERSPNFNSFPTARVIMATVKMKQ